MITFMKGCFMAVESHIDDILQNSEPTFRRVLSTIISNSDKNAEIELARQYTEVDEVLFEAIKSILSDLRTEEGMMSWLLYKHFNLELFKNKRREQLLILGSQLQIQYDRLKVELDRVNIYTQNLLSSLENLNRLKDAFVSKNRFLKSCRDINKSNSLIEKISQKIKELENYKLSLDQKNYSLMDTERAYYQLYRQIPGYSKLQHKHFILDQEG